MCGLSTKQIQQMGIVNCPSCFVPHGRYKNVGNYSERPYSADDEDEFVSPSDSSETYSGKFKRLNKLKNVFFGGQKRIVFFGPDFQKRYDRERKLRVKKKDLARCRGTLIFYKTREVKLCDN